jgi:nucleotide-binding universal stress UspA family protein
MKVTVRRGTVYQGAKHYGPGQFVDLDDRTAGELIAAGFVSKTGAPKTAEEIAAEAEAAAKKAAEEAAKKRKKAEEAAVKKGLGTAEEIAALSDEDLQSLFKAKK